MAATAHSNLEQVTLEIGGLSTPIVFGDADVDEAVRWFEVGIF